MSLTSRVDPQQNAPKDVMAAVKLAIDRRELFICGQLAAGLARLPGRLEFEEAEAYRILHQITVWYARGEFAADEVLVIFGEPPQLRPLREIEEQGAKVSTFEWREGIMLTRVACKRYLERSTLQGAPRFIRERFSIPTSGDLQGAADVTKLTEVNISAASPRKRGRKPEQFERVKAAMIADMQDPSRPNPENMIEKEWEATYGASRDTCRKAFAAVMSKNATVNSDK
jgi:hypothetical protein